MRRQFATGAIDSPRVDGFSAICHHAERSEG
jgi:hypothetical protein